MRRGLLLGLAIVFTLALIAPAQAKTGPGNSWTQVENHNWTPGSSVSPKCSPCLKWPNQFYDGVWHYGLAGNDFFHTQAVAATQEWNGQQYPSPVLDEGARGCTPGDTSRGNMCISAVSLAPGLCGVANDYADPQTHLIYHGLVRLNSNRGYTDGPSRNGSCDLRWAYRHEIGHVWSEGHSAISSDLMHSANNRQEHIDADAQAELKAVYGTFSSGGGGCPCINIQTLKQKMLQEAESLSGPSLDFGFPVAL
jgi:hypothetical protein